MAKLGSKSLEQKILALFFHSPIHTRALTMDFSVFSVKAHKLLAELIQEFVRKYRAPPTENTLKAFANSKLTEKTLETIPAAMEVVQHLPKVNVSEADYYFSQIRNYSVGRKIFDLQSKITGAMEQHEADFIKLKKEMLKELLFMGEDANRVRRGFVYENIKERWDQYNRIERGEMEDIVPFGMSKIDDVLGGMKKSFVTLIYSKTAGGKSRLAINIAYNAAIAGYNVMYISLEMAYDLIASCFDSRLGMVDSHGIIFGKLDKPEKRKYAKALKKQLMDKLNIWISDIPMGASVPLIMEEIEIYKAANGVLPDLIVADYANLLEPTKKYKDRSEKYDHLMNEVHQLARYYNTAFLTMMQESRTATTADLEEATSKRKKTKEGVHNIGLSNFAAIHLRKTLHAIVCGCISIKIDTVVL
jgi:replicative DNA helicase